MTQLVSKTIFQGVKNEHAKICIRQPYIITKEIVPPQPHFMTSHKVLMTSEDKSMRYTFI